MEGGFIRERGVRMCKWEKAKESDECENLEQSPVLAAEALHFKSIITCSFPLVHRSEIGHQR